MYIFKFNHKLFIFSWLPTLKSSIISDGVHYIACIIHKTIAIYFDIESDMSKLSLCIKKNILCVLTAECIGLIL